MGMVLLYGLAAFLETGIGIWIFGQIFPERERMEKRYYFSEWMAFLWITMCSWTFPKTFFVIEDKKEYIQTLILLHLTILLLYIGYKTWKKQWGQKEEVWIKALLFAGVSVFVGWQYWSAFQSYSMALCGNIYPVFFLWAFYECTLKQAYLWQFVYCTALGMLKNIYITYVGVMDNRAFETFFYIESRERTYEEVVYIFVLCIILILLGKYTPLKRVLAKLLKEHRKTLFWLTMVMWVILFAVTQNGVGQIKEVNLTVSLLLAGMALFSMMVLYIRAILRTADAEKKLLDVRNEVVERQYEEIKDAYERYRCVVHDEKHMLLYLKECLENQDMEHAKQVVDRYQTSLNDMGRCRWTGIQTVDFILSIKKRRMEEQAVSLELDCQLDSIPVEETDFIVLFSNLLDNAIEAAEQCPADRRKISIVLKNVNSMLYLKMTNSCQKQPQVSRQRFLTSKADQSAHGWGIESVKHIVEKYEGEIQFHDSRGSFAVCITI